MLMTLAQRELILTAAKNLRNEGFDATAERFESLAEDPYLTAHQASYELSRLRRMLKKQ